MTLRSCALLAALAAPVLAQPQPAPMPKISTSASDEDSLKIIALEAIMRADPDRGVPLAEGILKGSGSNNLKDRTMSALTQSKAPRAQQVVSDYAKSGSDAELQARAIRYIGRSGSRDAQQQIAAIYPNATDSRVKQEIIRSLMSSGSSDSLVTIAKSEKDPELRNQAIRNLASSENTPVATLTALYTSETDSGARRSIVNGLLGRGDAKTVIDLARKESDVSMKAWIVQRLSGMQRNKDAMDFMTELLK